MKAFSKDLGTVFKEGRSRATTTEVDPDMTNDELERLARRTLGRPADDDIDEYGRLRDAQICDMRRTIAALEGIVTIRDERIEMQQRYILSLEGALDVLIPQWRRHEPTSEDVPTQRQSQNAEIV
jgi:hypothetical protein